MKNFLNSNDIFTIMEMIKREINKNTNNQIRSSTITNISNQIVNTVTTVTDTDTVSNVTFERDNYDLISSVNVTFSSGATQNVILNRGVQPPVSNILYAEYYNTQLITGFVVETNYSDGTVEIMQGTIQRENNYGKPTGVSFTYS